MSSSRKVTTINAEKRPKKRSKERMEIKGVITSKSPGIIEVKQDLPADSEEDPYLYKIIVDKSYYHLSRFALPGDVISCSVLKEGKDDKCKLTLQGFPFVTTKTGDQYSTIQSMIRAVRVKGQDGKNELAVPIYILFNLFNEILSNFVGLPQPYGDCISVGEFISYQSGLYSMYRHSYVTECLLSAMNVKNLTDNHLKVLLKGWHDTNDKRLLHVLGIQDTPKDEIISKSYMTPDQFYRKLLSNPFGLYVMTTEEQEDIAKAIGLEYTDKMVTRGKLLRTLYLKTVGKGSTYISINNLLKDKNLSNKEFKLLLKDCQLEDDRLYIREIYSIEQYTVNKIVEIMNTKNLPEIKDWSLLDSDTVMGGIKMDIAQKEAVRMALTNNVCVITGSAGTGKTTIINMIIAILKANGIKFVCTSFTGKATARIEECCDTEAVNIDTMLALRDNYDTDEFKYEIVDETSMICTDLTKRYSAGLWNKTRITFVGDPGQLPPIGFGNVLAELIDSHCVPVIKLSVNYRVIKQSVDMPSNNPEEVFVNSIIENCRRISFWNEKNTFKFIEDDKFQVISAKSVTGLYQELVKEITKLQEKGLGPDDFVIISPYKRDDDKHETEYVSIINRLVQVAYNRDQPCVMYCKGKGKERKWHVFDKMPKYIDILSLDTCFHINDRVMCIVNNHGERIYNGQEGIVTDVGPRGVLVKFKKGEMLFSLSTKGKESQGKKAHSVHDLALNYAVTTHKMQGSQRNIVLYFLFRYSEDFIDYRVTYTTVSRAREEVKIYTLNNFASKSVSNRGVKKYDSIAIELQKRLPQAYKVIEIDEVQIEMQKRRDDADNHIRSLVGDAMDAYMYDEGDEEDDLYCDDEED